jgi:hypothetical protein
MGAPRGARPRAASRPVGRARPATVVGNPGRGRGDGGEGTGLEGGVQGGELLAHAAELARDQPKRRQMEEAPQAPGAQNPQNHRNDAGEGFGQGLGLKGSGFGGVCAGEPGQR